MLEELPPDSAIAQMLLADLAGDLLHRSVRLRFLLGVDADFGGANILLAGGETSWRAYAEARASFVAGNFLAAILLSQSLIENILGGYLILDDVSREVHSIPNRQSKPLGKRPRLDEMLAHAAEAGVFTDKDVVNIKRVIALRNPLSHFRDVNDEENLTRRAMDRDVHPEQIMFEDARFAVSTMISIARKAQSLIGGPKKG